MSKAGRFVRVECSLFSQMRYANIVEIHATVETYDELRVFTGVLALLFFKWEVSHKCEWGLDCFTWEEVIHDLPLAHA